MLKDIQDLLADDNRLTMIAKLAVEKLDMNRKGYLNKSEVKGFFEEVAEELDTQVTSGELEELFTELDENGTMKVTPEEIKSMIKQILTYLVNDSPFK